MTTQKVVEAAERYVSRQPVHTRVSGKPLYEHKQMIRAFCAGEIAVIDHDDAQPVTPLTPEEAVALRGLVELAWETVMAIDFGERGKKGYTVDDARIDKIEEVFARLAELPDDPNDNPTPVARAEYALRRLLPAQASHETPPPPSHVVGSEKHPTGSSEGIFGTTQWQLIDTAPKDGSFIDLWVEFYDQPEDDRPGPVRWTDCHWNGEKWENREGLTPDQYMARVVPTHWMPTPTAPTEHVAGSEERGIGIGMAIAAGIIMRAWGQEVYAREILGSAGLDTLEKLKASGVDQYDIDALMPVVATATEGSGDA